MDGMQEFRDLYIQTAQERIQALNDLLLKLEKNPEELQIIEELMRTGHSLKGESGAMGFEQIATLAHVIEDLFTEIGKQTLAINKEIMDALFESLDYIEESVSAISASPEAMDLDSSQLVAKLKKITGLKTEGFGKSIKEADNTQKSDNQTEVKVEIKEEVKVETVNEKKEEDKETAPINKTEANKIENDKQKVASKQISTVTLQISKLDKMINISEELILLKMKLKASKQVEENSQLKADIHRLDRLVTDMQFHIMQARLFPISLALHTLPRLVRDLASKTNKEIDLVLEGQETTVDRTIIDHLTEPFVHLVRNSVDHGIETKEERILAGKSMRATITLSAYTKENRFFVDISDDGAGIEWEKIAEAAVRKGAINDEEAKKMLETNKENLLFLDGVSTSRVVSDISGRGVGMGAVQRAIRKLGGEIMVKSKLGEGTTFTLRLPLTLAIVQALLVKVSERMYVIPSSEVVRSLQIKQSQIKQTGNKPVIVVDKREVFLIDLREKFKIEEKSNVIKEEIIVIKDEVNQKAEDLTKEILELKGEKNEPEETRIAEQEEEKSDDVLTVVLIRHSDHVIGCVVDKIVAEEEVLVKPLGSLLKKNTKYFSGATILADASAAPIINIEGII